MFLINEEYVVLLSYFDAREHFSVIFPIEPDLDNDSFLSCFHNSFSNASFVITL